MYWFCHISTWIHHRYTRVPHPEPSSLLPPCTIPSGSSQCTTLKHPVSCMEPGLATRFIYDIVHVSTPFSQIIPLSPSPTESVPFAVSYTGILLPSFYILYICVSILYLCFSFWLTSLCIIGSSFIRRVSTKKIAFFESNKNQHVCAKSF